MQDWLCIGEVVSYLRKSSALCASERADARIIVFIVPFVCGMEILV